MSAPTSEGSEGHNLGNQCHIPAVHRETINYLQVPEHVHARLARKERESLLTLIQNRQSWHRKFTNVCIYLFTLNYLSPGFDTFDHILCKTRIILRDILMLKCPDRSGTAAREASPQVVARVSFLSRGYGLFGTVLSRADVTPRRDTTPRARRAPDLPESTVTREFGHLLSSPDGSHRADSAQGNHRGSVGTGKAGFFCVFPQGRPSGYNPASGCQRSPLSAWLWLHFTLEPDEKGQRVAARSPPGHRRAFLPHEHPQAADSADKRAAVVAVVSESLINGDKFVKRSRTWIAAESESPLKRREFPTWGRNQTFLRTPSLKSARIPGVCQIQHAAMVNMDFLPILTRL